MGSTYGRCWPVRQDWFLTCLSLGGPHTSDSLTENWFLYNHIVWAHVETDSGNMHITLHNQDNYIIITRFCSTSVQCICTTKYLGQQASTEHMTEILQYIFMNKFCLFIRPWTGVHPYIYIFLLLLRAHVCLSQGDYWLYPYPITLNRRGILPLACLGFYKKGDNPTCMNLKTKLCCC